MWHKKNKVLAYITRNKGHELLVFEHIDFPAAGIQVPAGTVEPDEEILTALQREVSEESGLEISLSQAIELGRFEWKRFDRQELHMRHIFQIEMSGLKDSWIHTVSGSGEDRDLHFKYFWLPVESILNRELKLAAEQDLYLDKIIRK